ncbi:TRAP transporter small permease subunit [Psychromarinibacter sp. C21-152]|uniref:TRAP transporter small permease protein n=1 Tax=Psychromarinibacter sediminicola TaxID=3033385 RepID=A0AAE3NNZ2_9RHOB|nr:TRAP transporter small permease subunit [Psychromarinibacter sediminicola]MDF0599401.1 TRAP transporter small permease subunit [Psychromarinibacter sediminicola]
MSDAVHNGTRLHGLVLRICTAWAILGGVVLLAVVVVNVASVIAAAVFNKGLPGDFELTEVGVAIAAFSFLPYCQIAGLNVTADIFTARASKFWLSLFSMLGAIVALIFGAVLLWRMYYGMLDQRTYDTTTALLQIPLWWGYAGCLLSLALLVVASFASLVDALTDMFRR